jgi:hypothetical protein
MAVLTAASCARVQQQLMDQKRLTLERRALKAVASSSSNSSGKHKAPVVTVDRMVLRRYATLYHEVHYTSSSAVQLVRHTHCCCISSCSAVDYGVCCTSLTAS